MTILENIEFVHTGYFYLLLFVPIGVYLLYQKQSKGIPFIFLKDIRKVFKHNSFKFYTSLILVFLILVNYIIIISDPNKTNVEKKIQKNGIDIVIALDVSGSMEASDLQPTRIQAAKNVIRQFTQKLLTDRLGLVVFAGKPFTSIPLTFDYSIIGETISNLSTTSVAGFNGTAVGDAILMSEALFKKPQDISDDEYVKREKVIILLTDGDANVGVDPVVAGLKAKKDKIKIYTIGIGSEKGGILSYNVGPFKRQQRIAPLNDAPLKQIAKDTGGKYFKATDNHSLANIFHELSGLEKNDINIQINKEYSEYYNPFLWSLLILLSLFMYIISARVETNTTNH